MNQTSIKWWVRFLRKSDVYCAYHRAVTTGNTTEQLQLVSRYPKVEELYEDFGDVISLPIFSNRDAFQQWLQPRKHLFEAGTAIRTGDDITVFERPDDSSKVLVEIDFTDDPAKVRAELNAMVAMEYHLRFLGVVYGKKMLSEHPKAKYQLHTGGEKINAATVLALTKAFFVGSIQLHLQQEYGRKATQYELLLAAKVHKRNPFGWTLTSSEENQIDKLGLAQVFVDTNELTLIKRHLRAYKAYSHNLLQGRFPDHSST
jgi:hypothetical protein